MGRIKCRRKAIPFRSVNRRGTPGFVADVQRHHLLPRQLLDQRCFGRFFEQFRREQVGFDDFRVNGLLLPANENCARKTGLPLHRGPHREYSEMVIERVGRIEQGWSDQQLLQPEQAVTEALYRLRLLQDALRKRLLAEQNRIILNSNDPLGHGFDFSELDAMAEQLWIAS